ncbi:hypothetical protein [Actinomadura hibisca]|nr:hypothetical protein [Actinomadura hibisca]
MEQIRQPSSATATGGSASHGPAAFSAAVHQSSNTVSITAPTRRTP